MQHRVSHVHEINLVFRCHSALLMSPVVTEKREVHMAFSWIALQDMHTVDVRPLFLKDLLKEWVKGKECVFVSHH